MPFLIQFIILLVLFSAQTTILENISIAGVTPDLILIFVVFCGINMHGGRGVGMGFAVGFIQDCLSGGLLGVNTLSKSLIAFIFSALKDKILVEGLLSIFLFIIFASMLDGMIFYLVMVTLFKGEISGSFLFSSVPVYAIYNGCVGPILFYILDLNRRWIHRRFSNPYLRQS
ncbi:MAG: rod shape-determining protein MreD [Nitrospinaceae bacterium]|nr:MAG: rod shape-determining protein MreD [Nitrospinaceae bacterium]